MTREPLPTDEFNAGWEEGRHSADAEVGDQRAEIARLRAEKTYLGTTYTQAQAEIERLKTGFDTVVGDKMRLEAEIERLTAERANRYWEGRWRDEKAEIEQLTAKIAYVRQRSQWACEILNEFDNTRAALKSKP